MPVSRPRKNHTPPPPPAPPAAPPRATPKRSRYIALAALGVVVAAMWGSGEDNDPDTPEDAALYANIDECVRANVLGRDACEAQFHAAEQKYLTEAPKFDNVPACEASYGAGQCRTTTFNGAAVIVPAMVGFMVGNYLAANRTAQALLPPRLAAQPCPPGVTPAMQPGCVMPRATSSSSSSSSSSWGTGWRSYSTSAGATISRTSTGTGTTRVSKSVTRSGGISQSSTVSRGGFGSTSHRISSSSGS